jgi:hypothetical protein
MHIHHVVAPDTGSRFFGTKITGPAQADSAGTIQPLDSKSCRYRSISAVLSGVNCLGGRDHGVAPGSVSIVCSVRVPSARNRSGGDPPGISVRNTSRNSLRIEATDRSLPPLPERTESCRSLAPTPQASTTSSCGTRQPSTAPSKSRSPDEQHSRASASKEHS